MNGNEIPDLLSLDKELGSISSLTTIYLEGNPCQVNNMSTYRRKVMLALPQLKQIDATWVYNYTCLMNSELKTYFLGIRDNREIWTTAQTTKTPSPISFLVSQSRHIHVLYIST